MVESLYTKIRQEIEQSCPLSTQRTDKPTAWYNSERKDMSKKVRKAFDLARKSGKERESNMYKTLKKEYEKLCKKTRKDSWRKFKADTDSVKQTAFLANLSQRAQKHSIHTLISDNGEQTLPGNDTITTLMGHHFPVTLNMKHITRLGKLLHPS
jgi:hypothetical protein